MPTVIFEAWVNRNDESDPGQPVMRLRDSHIYREYDMGPPVFTSFLASAGKHAWADDSAADATTATTRDTAHARPARASDARRFTDMLSVEVDVSDAELRYLKRMAGLRVTGAGGLAREAQQAEPGEMPCPSSVEDLANLRAQRLGTGNAPELLLRFAELNHLGYTARSTRA